MIKELDRLEQFSKALFPIVVKEMPKKTDDIFVQLLNASDPIEIIESGMVIEVSPLPIKAWSPMDVNVFGRLIAVKPVQPEKAFLSMLFTECPILTEVTP